MMMNNCGISFIKWLLLLVEFINLNDEYVFMGGYNINIILNVYYNW